MNLEDISNLECYWYDINRWLIEHQPTIEYRFPPPEELESWDTNAWEAFLKMSREPEMSPEYLSEIFNVSLKFIGHITDIIAKHTER